MVASNPLTGDSRVQKVAWSAAAAGWDVVVVGTSPDAARHDERLGRATHAARVVRVPVLPRWTAAAHRLPNASVRRAASRTAAVADRTAASLRRRAYRRAAAPGAGAALPAAVLWRVAARSGRRRTLPFLDDLARALVPEVVAARPVLVHAHDYTTLPLAVAAADTLEAGTGRRPVVVYDAHEYLPGVQGHDAVWSAVLAAAERAAVARADAVVTVSGPLADLLQREHGLPRRPTVVENAPVVEGSGDPLDVPDLRSALGLGTGVPLLVYSGAVAPQRGVATAVDALPELPGVHLALVAAAGNRHVPGLLARAAAAGVADRVHVHPYVAPALVPRFLATADIGLIPLLHVPNHEIALITKYYEYLHARLPVVVSDVREMARETRELGNGEVFEAGSAQGFAAAVRAVLADRDRYVAALTPAVLAARTWEPQARALLDEYARLLGDAPSPPPGAPEPFDTVALVTSPQSGGNPDRQRQVR